MKSTDFLRHFLITFYIQLKMNLKFVAPMVFVLRVDSVAANFMETLIAQHLVSAFEMCHMHSGAVWSFVQSTRLPKIVLTFPLLPTQHSLSSAHKHTPEPGTVCNECTQ